MEANFFNENRKVTFLRNICRTLKEQESSIAGIQMKIYMIRYIFYERPLPEEQNAFYPDKFFSSLRKVTSILGD